MSRTRNDAWPGTWSPEQGWARARGRWSPGAEDEGPGRPRRGRRRHGFPGPWAMGPMGPGFGPPWGGQGRPRPRRGDVRLAVLSLLAEQPMHGYQMITELTERSGGAWRPSPGSIYPTLQQLEEEGLVTVAETDGRRTFSLTDAGREELQRTSSGRRAPWDELADEDGEGPRTLRRSAFQVVAAVMQVAAAGNDGQIARAERLLKDTRKAIYRLLAEDDDPGDGPSDRQADGPSDGGRSGAGSGAAG